MKKLINLAFALLTGAAAFAQGYNVEVCVNITGPQPNGPIVANLTYYSNGVANTMTDTLVNIQLPYNYCFPSYIQLPDSGFFAYANGFVQLSSCAPTQVYNYAQFVSGNSTVTVNAQNCQNFSNCTTTLAPMLGTNILIATSTGIGPFLYSWDGGITYTSNNQTVMNGIATYCVEVMDSIGCQSSDCYTNSSGGACQAGINVVGGGPYILTATSNGVAPLSYTWSTGELSQSIVADTTGYYCLVIVDANGCGDSACIYLTVGGNCSTYIVQTIVNGMNTLNAITDSAFSGNITYSWALNGAPIAGANSAQYIPFIAGQYCVTVDYNNGCTATNCYSYTTNGNCQASISVSGSGPYTFVATGSGIPPLTFNWSTGETTDTIVTTGPGTYCLIVTDAVGCIDSACISINNPGTNCNAYITEMVDSVGGIYLMASADTSYNGPVGYTWSTGESGQSIYPTQPGQYCVYLVYTNTSCYADTCYNFNPGNPVGGCSVVIAAVPDSTNNNSYTFYAYPTGTAPFSYSWMFSDGTTSNAMNPSVQFYNNSGINWANLTITDATGCVSSYSAVLPILPPFGNCYSNFSTYGNYQFGNPGEVFFQSYVQNSIPGTATYSWNFGDGTTSTLENPQHIFTANGFYNVCLTTTYNGCTYTSCNNEYVDLAWWNNNPFQGNCTAGFMILTNQVNSAGLINIINTSQGNNLFYTWSFGNGFISNNPLPFTTINNPGVYEICVSILDTVNNCGDTFCDTITIDSLGNVYRSEMSGNMGILVSGTPQPNALLTTVDIEDVTSEITIIPNPSNGIFSLNTNWIQGASSIDIIDITGNLVQSQTINTTKGQKSVALNLQDVADGSYLVRVVSNQRVQTVKLLVNH
jgi:PKD repeat protein